MTDLTCSTRAAFIVLLLLGVAGCADNAAAPSTAAPAAARPATLVAWAGVSLVGVEIDPTAINDGASRAGRVDFLYPGGPASAAGLRLDDLLLAVDGKPVTDNDDVIRILESKQPNTAVPVTLLRGGGRMTLDIQLGTRPANYSSMVSDALIEEIKEEHRAADAAETAANDQAAFDHYVQGLRYAFRQAWVFHADIDQMWTSDVAHLAALLPKLPRAPDIPSEANRHNRRALAILKDASSDADNDRAAGELWYAIYEAPWIADLYLNRGLVTAKAGYPGAGAADLRRYLVLNPGAADKAAVRSKIDELDVLTDELKPWLRFTGQHDMTNGGKEAVGLRHNQLFITAITGSPKAGFKAGDVLCHGTVRGTQFEGKCLWRPDPEDLEDQTRCFGASAEYNARGAIQGNTLAIDYYAPTLYHRNSCQVDPENWKWVTYRTLTALP